MKTAQVNYLNNIGGAGIAARRISEAVIFAGIESQLLDHKTNLDYGNLIGQHNSLTVNLSKIKILIANNLLKLTHLNDMTFHSLGLFNSKWPKFLNNSDFDVINLHWVGNEMMSIKDISRITKPLVWTFHDMWPLCGTEHYAFDERWRLGYEKKTRTSKRDILDINEFAWKRKIKYWRKPFEIVTPNNWFSEIVRKSILFTESNVTVIPNPVNTIKWQKRNKANARVKLGLPVDKLIVGFGAVGADSDPRKGFSIFLQAAKKFEKLNVDFIVFGNKDTKFFDIGKIRAHCFGNVIDEDSLIDLYSAMDCFVVSSVADNLPNTAIESMACGTPVVAFNVGALSEVVRHKHTGFLVEDVNFESLYEGINWQLENMTQEISYNARNLIEKNFSYDVVGNKYLNLYRKVLNIDLLKD